MGIYSGEGSRTSKVYRGDTPHKMYLGDTPVTSGVPPAPPPPPPPPPPSGSLLVPSNVRIRGCQLAFGWGGNMPDGGAVTAAEAVLWTFFPTLWSSWIQPQLDDIASIGANCVRIWGCPQATDGRSGSISVSTYLARWQQVLNYCVTKNLYVFPVFGDFGRWGGTDSSNVALAGQWAQLLAGYSNVIGVNLAAEAWARVVDGSGRGGAGEASCLNLIGQMKDAVNAYNLPACVSVSGITRASGGWTLDYYAGGANPASRHNFFALSDFNCVNIYDTWTFAEMQDINTVPALQAATADKEWFIGEFGTSVAPGPYSNIRTALYSSLATLFAADPIIVGGANWAAWDFTPDQAGFGLWGLYGLSSFPPGTRTIRHDIADIFQTFPITR